MSNCGEQIAHGLVCHKSGCSRGMALYHSSEDNSYYTVCHKCRKADNQLSEKYIQDLIAQNPRSKTSKNPGLLPEEMTKGKQIPLPFRGIGVEACKKYDVRAVTNTKGQITKVVFPFHNDAGELISQKIRNFRFKKSERGHMSIETIDGHRFSECNLFGANLFNPEGYDYITLVEGEFDCLATYELLGNKWPVVSLNNGAGSMKTALKRHLSWFMKAKKGVVILMDGDEEGQKAVEVAKKMIPKGKLKIMSLPKEFKDANDLLKASKERSKLRADFIDWWWKSEEYRPDGIVSWNEALTDLEAEEDVESLEYPWKGLQEITLGHRHGELTTWCSGSGMGKSQILREVVESVRVRYPEENIGIIMLEEPLKKTITAMASLYANKPFHVLINKEKDKERRQTLREERNRVAREMQADGRIWFDNHFGSNQIDKILEKIKYLAYAKNCKVIVLDHISILVSDQENGDERKAIDEIMTKTRTLVNEVNVDFHLVSHLKRPEGKGHEEGGSVSLAQLRGSASIAQLSDFVIGLERNQQHEDPTIRNITTLKVLKNRFTGETGPAGYLQYDKITGRMREISNEEYKDLLLLASADAEYEESKPINKFE